MGLDLPLQNRVIVLESFCHHSGYVVQYFDISSDNLVCDLKEQGGR